MLIRLEEIKTFLLTSLDVRKAWKWTGWHFSACVLQVDRNRKGFKGKVCRVSVLPRKLVAAFESLL